MSLLSHFLLALLLAGSAPIDLRERRAAGGLVYALAVLGVGLAASPFPAPWLAAWGWRGPAGLAKALLLLWAVQGLTMAPLLRVGWRHRRCPAGGGGNPETVPPEARRMPYGVAIALGVGLAAREP
ncbi:MAG: hypothetical protein ACE5JJ_09470 [Nitrospinota bacterium]